MLKNRFALFVGSIYLASGMAFSLEEFALQDGSRWAVLPPALFAALFLFLVFKCPRRGTFLLATLPAILLAEKQLVLMALMSLPYLLSRNPGI